MPLLGKDVTVIGPESEDGKLPEKPLFVVESFRGREALGAPFRYDLTVLSDEHNIPAFRVLGQSLTISINLGTGFRFFNGIVTYFAKLGFTKTHTRYALVLNPKLCRLDYARNCRIFKQASMSAEEADDAAPLQDTLSIVTSVLLERDVAEVDNATERQGDKRNHVVRDRHYCVQYRESDLNFVQRLLEEEGIYYFFTHELGKHTMVLADSIGAHRSKATTHPRVLYLPVENNSAAPGEHCWSLTVAGSLYAGKYSVLRGYDPTQTRSPVPVPDAKVDDVLAGNPQPGADFEDYDYPGGLCLAKQAKEEAQVRSEIDRSANTMIEVEGNTMRVGVGDLVNFVPDEHARDNPFWAPDDMNTEYMVTSATYSFTINQHEAGDPGVQDESFRARYTLIDANQQYRPQRTAPKPRIEGPQTAVVVGSKQGPPDEEIYTDSLGRVKIKFDWDRTTGGGDMDSSCWVRVSQVWAGQNWGAIHIPRVGHEVIVEFLDGDPDRPIITGRVYNANNPVPYTLPDHRTQSGIKSRSTNRGSPSNFNEIRFEDLKGKEELHIQAEKTMSTLVKGSQSLSVGGDRSVSVGGNESIDVKKKLTLNVHGGRLEVIEKGDTLSVQASDKRIEVDGQYTVFAKTLYQVIQGDDNELLEDGPKVSLKNKSCSIVFDAGDATITAADSITLECGASKLVMRKDGTIEMSGDAGVALLCGSTEAVLTPSSADMKRGGSVLSLTDASADLKGTTVKLNS
jgi:type VI secretion system secreted protein VgrG